MVKTLLLLLLLLMLLLIMMMLVVLVIMIMIYDVYTASLNKCCGVYFIDIK